MQLLIASHNPGKVNEFKKLMVDWPFEIVGLEDLGILEDVEETGTTFTQNALIKAEFAHKLTGLPTLSDDGGFEIDYLNGEPGVKSRRWKGYEMTDQEMVDYALEKTMGVPKEKRTCRLRAILCFIQPNSLPTFSEGSVEGVITEKQETPIIKGYPFRSIMILSKLNKMYTDVTEQELHQISHRLEALNQLRKKLEI